MNFYECFVSLFKKKIWGCTCVQKALIKVTRRKKTFVWTRINIFFKIALFHLHFIYIYKKIFFVSSQKLSTMYIQILHLSVDFIFKMYRITTYIYVSYRTNGILMDIFIKLVWFMTFRYQREPTKVTSLCCFYRFKRTCWALKVFSLDLAKRV